MYIYPISRCARFAARPACMAEKASGAAGQPLHAASKGNNTPADIFFFSSLLNKFSRRERPPVRAHACVSALHAYILQAERKFSADPPTTSLSLLHRLARPTRVLPVSHYTCTHSLNLRRRSRYLALIYSLLLLANCKPLCSNLQPRKIQTTKPCTACAYKRRKLLPLFLHVHS